MPEKLRAQFTFINVSDTATQTEAIRGTVSRHVQGFRRRKRQQDARRLLQSSKFVKEEAKHHGTSNQDLQTDRAESAVTLTVSRSVQVLPPLISIMLLNKDLRYVDTAPDISPAMFSFLIGFERDLVQPALAKMEHQVTRTTSKYNSLWSQATRTYLYDNLAVYSFLARIAATVYMVTGFKEHQTAATRYRDQAVGSLRHYLDSATQLDIKRLYRAIVILILAESAMGDCGALSTHTLLLRDLVLSHSKEITNDMLYGVDEVNTIVYQDVQIAVMSLKSTFFDLERGGWIEQLFHPLWQDQAERMVQHVLEADTHLWPGLYGETRNLYAEVRANMDMMIAMRQNHDLASTQTTWLKYFTRAVFVLGRLMNHYASLLSSRTQPGYTEFENVETPHLQASLCLCAVFWLREFLGVENVPLSENLRIFVANNTILSGLRECISMIKSIDNVSITTQDGSSSDAYLWILFSGASLERSLKVVGFMNSRELEARELHDMGMISLDQRLRYKLRAVGKTLEECHVIWQSFLPRSYLEGLVQAKEVPI